NYHNRGGPQFVSADHDCHPDSKAGYEQGFFHGGVAATDHHDVLVAEEEAVAGRAPRDAMTGQPGFLGQTQLLIFGSGGDDDRGSPISAPPWVVTCLRSPSRSRLLASSYSMMAPKSAACLARAIIRSGPWMPPGNPGKFSTSVVVMSAPPWLTEPAMTRGVRPARPA